MDMPEDMWHFRKLTVEPSLFLVAYAFAVSEAPYQDLLLKRICQETPKIPYEWCDSLPEHPSAEEIVHPKAANLLMISTMIESIVPAAISCWAGAWGDRSGSRKPTLIIPLVGYVLRYASLAVVMGISALPVEFVLLSTLPIALSGGWTTFFGAVTSIVGDETVQDGRLRTVRLGTLQVFYIIGFLPGHLSSSPTLNSLGYKGVFLLSSGICFLALLLALITVKDTFISPTDPGCNERCLLGDIFQTFTKRRSNGQKTCLLLGVSSLAFSVIAYKGESSLNYMYGRKEFMWTLMDYTLYNSIAYALQMAGTLLVITVLSHKMNIADAPIAALSYLAACVGSAIRAFASKSWMMYCGSAISMIHGAASTMMRSIISKSVPQNELGKVFSLTTSLEALIPLAAAPLYTLLFNGTLSSFPGAFLLLSSLIFLLDMVFSCVIHGTVMWHSRSEREPLLTREDCTSN